MSKKVNVCPNLLIYLRMCRKLSLEDIGDIVGLSFVAVRNRCLKLGMTTDVIGKRPPKRTRRIKVVPRDFTEAEMIAYEIGYRQGQSIQEIAEEHAREKEFVEEKIGVKSDE